MAAEAPMRIGLAILVFVLAACAGGHARPSSTPTSTAAPTVATTASPAPSTSAAATTTLRPTPNGVTADSPCLERAIFGDPAESEYVLPYAVGEEYYLSQSYCFSEGGHRNQLSYDFDMPIGARVLAARDGVVKEIKEDSPDTGLGSGQHNHVFIQHNDGTIGFYAHLMLDGVEVEPGDGVSAGDFIAYAGNSGMTAGPHLHFGVYQSWPPREGYDVPVNFCNAFGQHDSRRGLAVWRLFEALPTESC
jgi:murein DD-endopeptidase MepM/ murein hydrolase activator NlpD